MNERDTPDSSLAPEVKTCFVMMPFAAQFDRYYRNIFVPAIQKSGLEPVRGDGIFGSAIVADVWRVLKKSMVALADLTGRNPNVFYELGLAHALGKPVVLIASNTSDVPIDLGGLRVLLYNKDDEDWGVRLATDIERSIAEIIRDPVRGVPATFSDPGVQSCLAGDPLQVEIRQLAEEVRALRFAFKQETTPPETRSIRSNLMDLVLPDVFPRARELGLSWGQVSFVVDLVLAGRETEALSYMVNTGGARTAAESVLTFIRGRCRS